MTPREAKMLAVLKAVRSELPRQFGYWVSRDGEVPVLLSSETIDGIVDAIDQIETEERMTANECEASRKADLHRAMQQAAMDLGSEGDSIVLIAITCSESGEYELITALNGNVVQINAAMETAADQIMRKTASIANQIAKENGIQVPELRCEVAQ